jgi:DNA-binding transcriptional ArsR family regulator
MKPMTAQPLQLLRDPDRLRAALSPVRRRLLERLREPSSASMLAAEFDASRLKLNYPLKALEDAGLITLVEERPRRGFVERVLVACADAFLVDPSVVSERREVAPSAQDRFAADHLIAAAAGVVADVGRMQAAADEEGSRLLTFAIEADVTLARPSDLERYAERLAQAIAAVSQEFNAESGRRYRVVAGGHPALNTRKGAP